MKKTTRARDESQEAGRKGYTMGKIALRMIRLTVLAILVFCLTLGGINLIRRDAVLQVKQIAFSPKGDLLAVGGNLNNIFTLAVFDSATRKRIAFLDPPRPNWGCRFSPEGQSLISWGRDEVVFWDTRHWKVKTRLKLTTPPGSLKMRLDPDAKTVAFFHGRTVKIWDALKDEELFSIPSDDGLGDLVFFPDAEVLAIASYGRAKEIGSCKAIDLATRRIVFEFPPVSTGKTDLLPGIYTAAFSADGGVLAMAERKGSRISVWDLKQHKRERILKGHLESITLAFSPDGKLLASGEGGDVFAGELRIWDWAEEKELISLTSTITGRVECVAFSPDGKTLAYGMSGRPGGFEFLNVEDFCQTPK
jgi:WD40 repeat protein